MTWLHRETKRLDEALVDAGFADEASRRAVCESFFFGLTYGFDQEPLVIGEATLRPVLAFADGDRLVLADEETFAFHEVAHGVVGEAFGDD